MIYERDEDFPAEGPAKELGAVVPGAATQEEQARLKQLEEAVAKQRDMHSKAPPPLVVPDDEDAAGAQNLTGVMGYVSREEGNLNRMKRGLAYKSRRREEYRQQAVALFTARRDMINFTELVTTVQQCRRRTA